jgi:glycine dehydrogenase subunit 2
MTETKRNDVREDPREKVARLARLRRDGGVLRDYRAPRWDEPFIMEQGTPGERGVLVPLAEDAVTEAVGAAADYIPEGMRRAAAPALPELSQHQVLRHYLRYSQMTLGMDLGSDISEGTCTMKYSPKMHEELVRYHRAADLHPWQDEDTLQGLLEIVFTTGEYLKAISGMDAVSFQPGGGSHAVFTNACVMRRYFEARGELGQRDEMITTIFSHPCDAATPKVAGFKVVTVMPDENGYPDLGAFRAAVSERTVGCMITNPEDTGIYNPQIDKYVEALHDVGALAFTDQANANGILGIARARDAGFDACHFNLHKTFSSPHGCEGPATGAYLCTDELAPYLPVPVVTKVGEKFHLDYDRPESIGRVRGFLGNWMGVIRAYTWIRHLGPDGLREVAEISVLNNNYLDNLLLAIRGVSRPYAQGHRRLDQVRYSLQQLKEETTVGTEAVRDRMIDFGVQSYWMSHHPWVVPEPFTPEPCETYSKADLDEWAAVIKRACDEAYADARLLHEAPHAQPIDQMRRTEAMEDPGQWAFTWRKYKRKFLAERGAGPLAGSEPEPPANNQAQAEASGGR